MKEKDIMKVDLDTLLTDITYQTFRIFKGQISEEQTSMFREYLEDTILFDIISCRMNKIECASFGKEVTENIRLALIASGISKNGTIPEGTAYIPVTYNVKAEDHYYAKKRVRDIDAERQEGTYLNKMYVTVQSFRLNNPIFPNAAELVEMGIAQNERNCGYIEDRSDAVDYYEGATQVIWMSNQDLFKHYGLEHNLSYGICKLIFSRPQSKHYPLATKIALRNMAEICLYIAQNGKDSFNDSEKLEETFRNIEAAKITDSEIIEKFEKAFRRIVAPSTLEEKNNNQLETNKEQVKMKKRLFLLPNKKDE